MIFPHYESLPIIPSRAASTELIKYGLDLYDVLEILENGYDCSKSKRAKKTIEKCLDHKKKTHKVVAVKVHYYSLDTEAWLITHVGITSKRRMKK